MTAIEVVFFTIAPTLVLLLVLYSLRDKFADNWRAVLFLAAACLLFFHRIVFLGEALSQSDANLLQLQFFTVYRDAIRMYGEIPFWNPYIGAGVPNLANPISAMFYPLAPLFLFVNVFTAMSAFVVCHYFLAAVFALFLARRIFRTRQAALLFALLYAFNGWAITRAAHQPAIEYLFAYTWLPLAALAFENALEGESLALAAIAGGAALSWMGTACPNLFVYAAVLVAVAFIVRSAVLLATMRSNAFATAVSAALAMLLFAFLFGAVEYIPARQLASLSSGGRLGENLPGGWRGQSLSPLMLVEMYFPYVPGRPFGVYYSPGAIALVLALGGIVAAVRFKAHRGLAAGAAVVLVAGAALAAKTPLYVSFARASAVFGRSSLMPACLILLVLPVIVLAAVGAEWLVEKRRCLTGNRGYVLVALVLLELFVGFGVIYPRLGQRRLAFDWKRALASFPHLDEIARSADPGRIFVRQPPEGDVLAPSYAVLPRGLSRLNVTRSDFAPDGLADALPQPRAPITPQALGELGVGWLVSTEKQEEFGQPAIVHWPGVANHYEDNIFFPLRHRAGWLAWDKRVYLYRLQGVPSPVRAEPPSRRSIITGLPETPLEGLASSALADFAEWTPIVDCENTANTLTFFLPEAAPTRYFCAVTSYPGWRVFADGVEVPHVTAGGAFVAADVPEGTSYVQLRFEPTHWKALFALAAAATVLAVVAVGREAAKPRRTPPAR